MAQIDDRHLMTDEKLLELMEKAATAPRQHSAFDHWEDGLFQRHVRFDYNVESADMPFNREKVVRKFFPEAIQDRYFEIRSRIYPDLSGRADEA